MIIKIEAETLERIIRDAIRESWKMDTSTWEAREQAMKQIEIHKIKEEEHK